MSQKLLSRLDPVSEKLYFLHFCLLQLLLNTLQGPKYAGVGLQTPEQGPYL